MSKAFTREDDAAEEPILRAQISALPPGVKNYLTADGAEKLQKELDELVQDMRPRASGLTEPEESKRQLLVIDQRIAQISQSLQSAEIVLPPANSEGVVRFGATVTVRNRAGEKLEYRVVGSDETDLDRGWVSWRSPIARALINARMGQRVRFRFPAGEDDLEIIRVTYL
ncbi:MAG: GreA/GreB family elongation factor [Verrucomicrobiota bacterium]